MSVNNEYKLMEPQPAEPLQACPCCGSAARVWEYVEKTVRVPELRTRCQREGLA